MKHLLSEHSTSQRLLTAIVAGLLLGFLGDQFAENLLFQQIWLSWLVVPLLFGVIEALITDRGNRYPKPTLSTLGAGWLIWLSACLAFWGRSSFRSHPSPPCLGSPCLLPDDFRTNVYYFFLFIFPFGLALVAMSALLTMRVLKYMRNKFEFPL